MQISTPDSVVKAYPMGLFSVTATDIYQLLHDLQNLPHARSVFAFGQAAHLSFKKGKLSSADVVGFLREKKHEEVHVEEIKPSIEDCFMELMQTPNSETAKRNVQHS